MSWENIAEASATIAEFTGVESHDAAVVLGSGLSDYAASVEGAIEMPYGDIPHFLSPAVSGHAGALYSIEVVGGRVLAFAGRVHTYEGWDMSDVVFGARVAAASGCSAVLLTNAAGGLGDGFEPGDLVAIRDHLNLTGRNPLVGPNDERMGPRFPDMSEVYSVRLRGLLGHAFAAAGVPYKEGVYAWFLGPSYETPAEVQMAKRMGADLVGMSTVPEAIALRHMGVEVAGISLVTNLAAGVSPTPLSHTEVTATAAEARQRFTAVLDSFLPLLVAG